MRVSGFHVQEAGYDGMDRDLVSKHSEKIPSCRPFYREQLTEKYHFRPSSIESQWFFFCLPGSEVPRKDAIPTTSEGSAGFVEPILGSSR